MDSHQVASAPGAHCRRRPDRQSVVSDTSPTLKDRELAGYVAPIIRSTDERVLRRKVNTYDRETGETTGEVTMREVVGGLAKVTALGLEVVEGVRPKEVACTSCGRPVSAATGGTVRTTCRVDTGCRRRIACVGGCGLQTPRNAMTVEAIAKRGGRPWRCQWCKRTSAIQQTHCAGGCGQKIPVYAISVSHTARRGGAPWMCARCSAAKRGLVERQTHCAGWNEPCEAVPPPKAFSPSHCRSRDGRPWRCKHHAALAAGTRPPPRPRIPVTASTRKRTCAQLLAEARIQARKASRKAKRAEAAE